MHSYRYTKVIGKVIHIIKCASLNNSVSDKQNLFIFKTVSTKMS